jgi:hypothetical protein
MKVDHKQFDQQAAMKTWIARTLAGRQTCLPTQTRTDLALLGPLPSRHWTAFRLPEGLLIWFECWCDNEEVVQFTREWALRAAAHGYRCAFLDTRLSYRWPSQRRPLLVAPPESNVDFDRVSSALATRLPAFEQAQP